MTALLFYDIIQHMKSEREKNNRLQFEMYLGTHSRPPPPKIDCDNPDWVFNKQFLSQ